MKNDVHICTCILHIWHMQHPRKRVPDSNSEWIAKELSLCLIYDFTSSSAHSQVLVSSQVQNGLLQLYIFNSPVPQMCLYSPKKILKSDCFKHVLCNYLNEHLFLVSLYIVISLVCMYLNILNDK